MDKTTAKLGETVSEYVKYSHHEKDVFVRADLKGKHRECNLCCQCTRFKPDTTDRCLIAADVYWISKKYGIVTPVWECQFFKEQIKAPPAHEEPV